MCVCVCESECICVWCEGSVCATWKAVARTVNVLRAPVWPKGARVPELQAVHRALHSSVHGVDRHAYTVTTGAKGCHAGACGHIFHPGGGTACAGLHAVHSRVIRACGGRETYTNPTRGRSRKDTHTNMHTHTERNTLAQKQHSCEWWSCPSPPPSTSFPPPSPISPSYDTCSRMSLRPTFTFAVLPPTHNRSSKFTLLSAAPSSLTKVGRVLAA